MELLRAFLPAVSRGSFLYCHAPYSKIGMIYSFPKMGGNAHKGFEQAAYAA